MGWKEHIKPTNVKILLAALLFVLFVPSIRVVCTLNCPKGVQCVPPLHVPDLLSLTESARFFFLDSYSTMMICNPGGVALPETIFGSIIAYLAACLLIFLYSKLSKKPAKKPTR